MLVGPTGAPSGVQGSLKVGWVSHVAWSAWSWLLLLRPGGGVPHLKLVPIWYLKPSKPTSLVHPVMRSVKQTLPDTVGHFPMLESLVLCTFRVLL